MFEGRLNGDMKQDNDFDSELSGNLGKYSILLSLASCLSLLLILVLLQMNNGSCCSR